MTVLIRIILIVAGCISLGLGVLGIFVPGLPTTPFLLLSAGLFARSSEKLYNWLIHHRYLGRFIRHYRIYKAVPLRVKIYATTLMWIMIGISTIFFIENLIVSVIVILAGITGTIVMNWVIPTCKKR
ncbi:MAG: YbaN family protein [Bacteroidales bacterium]